MSETLEARVDRMFDLAGQDDTATANATTETDNVSNEGQGSAPTDTQGITGGSDQSTAATPGSDKSASSTVAGTDTGKEHAGDRQVVKAYTPGRQRLPADAEGNLVDPATGRVVAKAGNERALYESARNFHTQMQQHRGQAETLQRELDKTTAHLTAFREAAQLPTQLGLQPQEVTTAMQFMAHFKANPVEAAKKVLTEVLSLGHNLEDLKGSVDMAAIQRMIQTEVAPFKQNLTSQQQQHEQQQQLQQYQAQADRELEELFDTFPWAEQQQVELQRVLEADERLSLREATLMLQAWAYKNGYDLNQPLTSQHDAAVRQPQQRQQPQRMNAAQVTAPSGSTNGSVVPRVNTAVGHDRSMRDIVSETLREHGININR
jgi:hypothetical protein